MKTRFFLTGVLLLSMAIPALSQTQKEDYIDFNSDGRLVSFKKTAPDGSWIELTTDRPGESPYFYNLSVHCSDGEILEAYLYTQSTNREDLYKSYVDKAKTFNTAINEIYGLSSYDDKHQAYCIKPDGTVFYYTGNSDTFHISEVQIPLGKNGDYVKCHTGNYRPLRYFDLSRIRKGMIGDGRDIDETFYGERKIKVRKTIDDCVMDITVSLLRVSGDAVSIVINGDIYYNDGSSYSGIIEIPAYSGNIKIPGNSGKIEVLPARWDYWRDLTEKPNFIYKKGVVTTADKQYKAFEDGEYSSFETARIVQSLEKKAAEKKAEEEAIRKAKLELNKKYGEKYVTAMLNGKLILGTPEELFLLGMKIHAYRSFVKAECFYTNGTRSLYNIYGWEMNPDSYLMITDSALLGMIKFENGVLVSALK